jgi:hypothetical protein
MNIGDENIVLISLIIIVVILSIIAILVILIRWLFRINEIVALLKDILAAVRPRNSTSAGDTRFQRCEGCNRNFDKSQLKKIASGQMLCPDCINNLKNRR